MKSDPIIPRCISVYKSWNRMLGVMGKHVAKNGFHLKWWKDDVSLGFKCERTTEVWALSNANLTTDSVDGILLKSFENLATQKKFLDALEILLSKVSEKEDLRTKCKSPDCEKPATKDELCGWCTNRFKKGLVDSEGLKIKSFDEKKESIASKITMDKLKLYQIAFPESKISFQCAKLNIFIEEASCFRRIFIEDTKKQCRACKIHEKKFGVLEKFLDESNNNVNLPITDF